MIFAPWINICINRRVRITMRYHTLCRHLKDLIGANCENWHCNISSWWMQSSRSITIIGWCLVHRSSVLKSRGSKHRHFLLDVFYLSTGSKWVLAYCILYQIRCGWQPVLEKSIQFNSQARSVQIDQNPKVNKLRPLRMKNSKMVHDTESIDRHLLEYPSTDLSVFFPLFPQSNINVECGSTARVWRKTVMDSCHMAGAAAALQIVLFFGVVCSPPPRLVWARNFQCRVGLG